MESSSVWKGLLYGGTASCVADFITMPVDVVKTRMQIQGQGGVGANTLLYRNAVHAAVMTVRNEGVRALFKGLSPALLRQSTYGSARYGLYTPLKQAIHPASNPAPITIAEKVLAGSLSGAVASALFTPTDLIKVRMQAHGMFAAATLASASSASSSHEYANIWRAGRSIVHTEGVLGLWRGVVPTCARATVLAAAELSSYDHFREMFLQRQWLSEGVGLHVATALAAGFISSFMSSPFDVVKSRMMQGRHHKSMFQCFQKTIQEESVFALWRGFGANYSRVGPRVLIIFVMMEQLKLYFG